MKLVKDITCFYLVIFGRVTDLIMLVSILEIKCLSCLDVVNRVIIITIGIVIFIVYDQQIHDNMNLHVIINISWLKEDLLSTK